jgi:hypothetical protein
MENKESIGGFEVFDSQKQQQKRLPNRSLNLFRRVFNLSHK